MDILEHFSRNPRTVLVNLKYYKYYKLITYKELRTKHEK